MHSASLASWPPLLLTAVLAAQHVAVFPSDHADLEGAGAEFHFPYSNGVSRQQAIYHRFDLRIPGGTRITRAGVRQDATSSSAGYRVEVQVLMGQTPRDPRPGIQPSISSTFANNYATAPVTVFARRFVDLPALVATSQRPAPTMVTIPLDVSFQYDDTSNLVVEWVTFANSNGDRPFNYGIDIGQSVSPVAEFGSACRTSANTTPRATFSPTTIGTTCYAYLNGSAANSPSIMLLGAAAQPLPVPLDLLGMTGCFLHIAPLVQFATTTGASGHASLGIPVPNQLFLVRSSITAQFVSVDLPANAAGLVASNGARATFGVAPLTSLVLVHGSATSPTGGVLWNYGPVAVFEWQ